MSTSKGLGDTVEKFTKATGIKSLMDISMGAIGKKDCGCNKRKQWLNKNFPYKK
tara:strand:- start:110 stop:271 length:162 start_codon:yes stop_codon:yes gene_type:complete